jgi:putative inorganic carbon (hco3(-)) transporter
LRDILILLIVVVLIPVAAFHPWLGIMGWTVLSIANPHRYAWAASHWPLAAAVAIATLMGLVLTRDRRDWSVSPPTAVLLAFMLWMCVTLPFSISITDSLPMWERVMKIDLMILVAMVALTTRHHVMALVWVLVASIGIYGFKGGLYTIATGGAGRVWGPPGSFIEGNNELALALIVTIPLMRFLQLQAARAWVRYGLTILMLLCTIAALGTQSRGALLALAAMAAMLFARGGGRRLWLGMVMVIVGTALIAFMPATWDQRMSTIIDYQRDSSAMGRINAWWMAWNLAKDHFFGGGYAIYDPATFARYAPNPGDVHAAHSIFFQILGEHGFVGLALFLLLGYMIWRWAGWLRRNARANPETQWAADLGSLCQVSLVGFAVGGAFLSLAYFDLPYNLLVLVVVARRCVRVPLAARVAENLEPAARAPQAARRAYPTMTDQAR